MTSFAIGILTAIAHSSAIASFSVIPESEKMSHTYGWTEKKVDETPSTDFHEGKQTSSLSEPEPNFSLDDELILQLRVKGVDATDTILAYGTRESLYLPFGELARILDLAIRVSDNGHYASGWFLDESRTVTLDLRQGIMLVGKERVTLREGDAQAFDGELFLRSDLFADILPLELEPSLRTQSVLLTTLEPFPFQERMLREAQRERLGVRLNRRPEDAWPREETPWLAASIPVGDLELRAVADSAKGARMETDLRLAGDLAMMTAQTYFSATTRDGLVASLIQMGRRDPDANLLGPLQATEFQFGDVSTSSMPVGARGRTGRGAYITNRAIESASVFEELDLRGVLPNGYEVELYRNEVLLGSVATATNGQYEFLQVPVDYGLNVFRLVFYGPQGQRREEVKKVSVGDGRLSSGQLEYEFGAIQRDVNLLGVNNPDFRPRDGYGTWQTSGRVSYGINQNLTAVASVTATQAEDAYKITSTGGLRTSLSNVALRTDAAFSSDGGFALGGGVGTRLAGGSLTFTHFEYGGGFVDELRNSSREPLQRSTELGYNATLKIGLPPIPITGRARHTVFADGRTVSSAALRGSVRAFGLLASNSFEYSSSASVSGASFSQLLGNFDLATFKRSRVQLRGSVGYQVLQEPELSNVTGAIDYQLDDRTVVSGQANYTFNGGGPGFGLSAIRELDRFTVALDGNYAAGVGSYSAALRIGFSFGRDPLSREFYLGKPGQASFGATSIRAFQDMDGDGSFSEGDIPLPNVDFAVFNNVATTDENGFARLGRLGHGNRTTIQADPSSFPDILMAPVNRGIEIAPRAGRTHVTNFPIVALSEVEGTVSFKSDESIRGVAGLKLELVDENDQVRGSARTERDGYFFMEGIKPDKLRLRIEPGQASALNLCLLQEASVLVEPQGKVYSLDATIEVCE